MNGLTNETSLERALGPALQAFMSNSYAISLFLAAHRAALVTARTDQSRSYTSVGIKYAITFMSQSQDAAFYKLHRELAGMRRLLWMIRFNIGNVPETALPILQQYFPNVGWIFTSWMA